MSMLKQESLVTDILVIGSGIAGMVAAIEARKSGAEVSLVTKAGLGKESATSRALLFRTGWEERSVNIPGYDDKPGKYMEDQVLVHTLAQEGCLQMQNLIDLGVPMLRLEAESIHDTTAKWQA